MCGEPHSLACRAQACASQLHPQTQWDYNVMRLLSGSTQLTCDACIVASSSPRSYQLLPVHPSIAECRSGHAESKVHSSACVLPRSAHDHDVLTFTRPLATRYLTRHKSRKVQVIEAHATDVDVRISPRGRSIAADVPTLCSQLTRQ